MIKVEVRMWCDVCGTTVALAKRFLDPVSNVSYGPHAGVMAIVLETAKQEAFTAGAGLGTNRIYCCNCKPVSSGMNELKKVTHV